MSFSRSAAGMRKRQFPGSIPAGYAPHPYLLDTIYRPTGPFGGCVFDPDVGRYFTYVDINHHMISETVAYYDNPQDACARSEHEYRNHGR